eukprot:COSAG02_NODE_36946_length_448_cov_1.063037_1_plen_54_part_10
MSPSTSPPPVHHYRREHGIDSDGSNGEEIRGDTKADNEDLAAESCDDDDDDDDD